MPVLLLMIVAYLLLESKNTTAKTQTTGTPLQSAANPLTPSTGYIANQPTNSVALASSAGLIYDSLTGVYVDKTGKPYNTGNAGNSGVTSSNPNSISDPTAANDPNSIQQYDYAGNPITITGLQPDVSADSTGTTSGFTGVLLSDANSLTNYNSWITGY